jgi:CubicO group peptidase (beta-lactamase class C family)
VDSLYIEENNDLIKIIDNSKLHELRSCSKILVSMAVGIAIEENLLSLDDLVYEYIKDYIINKNNVQKIKKWTIRTLLTHTVGYDKMLMSNKEIKEKNLDKSKLLEYVLNYDIKNEPNKKFVYNNAEPFIISVIFNKKLKLNLTDYIKEKIFEKLEIDEFVWENYGNFCPGCTGLFLKPLDFYKIGKLLLNDGIYNDKKVLSKKWVNEMINIQLETPYAVKRERVLPKYGIGYFTFISRDGYIFRDGTNGQYIILNKNKNMLICLMSSEKDMSKITEIFRNIL